ncbi:310_t:CDS:2, partial [Paraglomus occultum]
MILTSIVRANNHFTSNSFGNKGGIDTFGVGPETYMIIRLRSIGAAHSTSISAGNGMWRIHIGAQFQQYVIVIAKVSGEINNTIISLTSSDEALQLNRGKFLPTVDCYLISVVDHPFRKRSTAGADKTFVAEEANNVNRDTLVPENIELKTTLETESSEDTNDSPVFTEFAPDFDTIEDQANFNNGEFAWRGTPIQNLYRLIELRSDTSTTGTVDKAIIHPQDLGNLCNALAPESYHSIADIRFEKLGKEHLDLVGCYGNRKLILKLLLQSNCINQDSYEKLVKSERDSDPVLAGTSLTTGLYLLLIKP